MIGLVNNNVSYVNNKKENNSLTNTNTQTAKGEGSFAQMLSMMNAKTLAEASSQATDTMSVTNANAADNVAKASDIKDGDIFNLMNNLPSSTRNLLQSLNLENSQLKGILANMYTAEEISAFTGDTQDASIVNPITASSANDANDEMLEDSEIMNRLQTLFTHNVAKHNEADDYIELINSSKSYL